MRRTTITIEDGLFTALRQRAARENRSLKDLLNALLREALAPRKAARYRCDWRVVKGRGLQPGVNLQDREALWDRMEGR